jgi:hypothetical protein
MSNSKLLCLALKVLACGQWSYELVALLVVNQRAPNCENDRDPGAGRKVLEELTRANVCRANRD